MCDGKGEDQFLIIFYVWSMVQYVFDWIRCFSSVRTWKHFKPKMVNQNEGSLWFLYPYNLCSCKEKIVQDELILKKCIKIYKNYSKTC